MKLKVCFLNFLLSFMLIGCSLMPNEMKTAQKILDSNPDSALHILQQMHPNQSFLNADRALYGILLFQALDKSGKTLQPDSVINFSVRFYEQSNDNVHLAIAYYYKARLYKSAQQFDKATVLYLKSLDIIQNKDFELLGKIYSDLGDICAIQTDFQAALSKQLKSYGFFVKGGDSISANNKMLDIGRMYRLLKDYKTAKYYFTKTLLSSKDSFLHGTAYQEIGINFYNAKRFDSAEYFLRESLKFPSKGSNYAIRNYILADLYFDTFKYNLATVYALNSLKYPANFITKRECYRILANSRYSLGDLKEMAVYMSKFQECTDSVRKIEAQTKTSVLEDLHQTSSAINKSRQSLIILAIIILLITLTSLSIVFTLRNRSRNKQIQLEKTEEKLSEKQLFLKDSLIHKIQENRMLQAAAYKKANIKERELIYKELFNTSLQLDDWEAFKKLMNKTFNNLVTELETRSSEINHKEIMWCCLFLLNVPTNEMIVLLECQQRSLYKMKQRMTQKLRLTTTTEFEQLLLNLSEDK
ncbi:MAG: tetratricopeptide repeat protein [Bacteroidota bacterium]